MGYAFGVAESERPLFSIGAVARMLDCAPATIRTWEARYGLIVPERSSGGQRLFSADQVDQLRYVKELLDSGVRPAEAHRLLRESGGGGRSRGRVRVMLVAGRAQVADVVRQLLGSEGFEVVVASDPADATRHAPAAALAVVDIARTDGLGAEVARTLRQRGLRVLALGSEDDAHASQTVEADAFLPLPVEADVLLQAARGLTA